MNRTNPSGDLTHQACKLLYTPISLYSWVKSSCQGGKAKSKKNNGAVGNNFI